MIAFLCVFKDFSFAGLHLMDMPTKSPPCSVKTGRGKLNSLHASVYRLLQFRRAQQKLDVCLKNYARCQPRFSQVLTTCCFPASSAEGPPPSCTPPPPHPPTPLHSSPKAIRHGPLPTRDLLVLLTPVRLGLTPVTLGITLQCLPVVICQHRRTLTGRHGRTSRYGILSTKQTFC